VTTTSSTTSQRGDLTKYTIIRASAGSGKTYSLVDLLTRRLRAVDGHGVPQLRPDQVIATTFTRKAAGELSTRIRERLVEEGLLRQASAMPTSLIGTVNSITGRILQDFAMDAGLSPELSILTDQAATRAFTIATSDILAEAEDTHRALLARTGYDLPEGDDPMYNRGRRNWAGTVRTIVDLARSNDISGEFFEVFAQASKDELRELLDATARTKTREGGGATTDTPPGASAPAPAPTPIDARARVAEAAKCVAASLREDLAAGSIKPRKSVEALERILPGIERFATTHTGFSRSACDAREHLTWKAWFGAAKGAFPDCEKPSRPIQAAVDAAMDRTWFSRDPEFRADLESLIDLVFTTAARCLAAYGQYKTELGLIDYIDQEHLTLHLLRDNAEVRSALTEQYRILFVDEFQDTSPLELALFTELGALVQEVVWVGDPKQSIYSFRDSDPALMGAAVAAIMRGGGRSRVLSQSWRSHEVPLAFTNTVFSRVFAPAGEIHEGDLDPIGSGYRNPEVWLDIPAERAADHAGGEALVWQVQRTPGRKGQLTNEEWFTALVRGISDARETDRVAGRTGSWAVLTRTNRQVEDIQSVLRAHGIPCTGGGTPLLATREGATLRAALSWLIDPRDTQSLVELIMVLSEHPAHEDWLQVLSAAPDRPSRRDLLGEWGRDPSLAPVRALRRDLPELSVREVVVALVDALDLRVRIAEWGDAGRRAGAVVGVIRAAEDYTTEAESAGKPVTLSGFLSNLDNGDATTTAMAVADADAVTVSTTHQAKGLEWDSVVLALPDRSDRFRAAGAWVRTPGELVMDDPLAGRGIRFWPETALEWAPLGEAMAETPTQQARRRVDRLEARRVFYVACTRAKRRLVLGPKTTLKRADVFDGEFTLEAGEGGLDFHIGDPGGEGSSVEQIACDVARISADAEELAELADRRRVVPVDPAAWVDVKRSGTPEDAGFVPATFTASGATMTAEQVAASRIRVTAELGEPIVSGGGPEWERVGDCLHAYLATPYPELAPATRVAVAERLVRAWGVGSMLSAAEVVDCGQRWSDWIDRTHPGAVISTEIPFTWMNEEHQRTQGWLDQLIRTPGGDVIVVDHKTYPGSDPIGHVREHYLGQMATYRAAVSQTLGGRGDVSLLIHLPLLGKVLEVTGA